MQLEVSLIQLITICSVINGLVFAVLLFEKKENRLANRFLSLTILSMCLTFTPFILDVSVWNQYQSLAWLPFSLSYWIGPSFYFYIKTLTQSSISIRKKDLWHFAPILLNYLHSIYHMAVVNTNPWPWFHHVAEWELQDAQLKEEGYRTMIEIAEKTFKIPIAKKSDTK